MGDLHGDPRSFSAPPLILFWGGGLSPLRWLFFKFAFGAVYTGTSVLSLLRYLFFLGRGVRFFLRFQCGAVLYFRCWARGGRLCFLLCLGAGAPVWVCRQLALRMPSKSFRRGVNKKNTLPGGRPANREPAGARVRGAGEPQSGGQ